MCNPQQIDTRTVPVQGTYYQFTSGVFLTGVTALTRAVSGEKQIYSGNLDILPGIGKPGKFFGKNEIFSGHWAKIWYYMLSNNNYIYSDMYPVYALYSMYFDTWKRLNFPWYEKTNQQRFQLKSMKFECDWPRAIPSRSTQEPYRCKVHTISSPQIVQGYFYAAR